VSGDGHVVSTWKNNLIPVVLVLKLKFPIFCCRHLLSYKIDFENVDENLQILALIRAAAGF
jgi:hypothetical protein